MFYLIEPRQSVFSTYVEVILLKKVLDGQKRRILHVCGGDPHTNDYLKKKLEYSPRMWR